MSLKQQLVQKDEKQKKEMQQQNTISTTSRTRKNIISRGKRTTKHIGAKNSDTLTKSAYAFDFLTTEFKDRSALEIGIIHNRPINSFNNSLYEIGIEETIDTAYNCMLNYAKIRGIQVETLNMNSTVFNKSIEFHNNMIKLLPNGVSYNIEHDYQNDVHLVLYKADDSWDGIFFIIPVEPLYLLKDILSKKLFTLVFDAFTLLIQNACIPKWDEGRFDVNIDIMVEEAKQSLEDIDDEEEVTHYNDIISAVDSYNSVNAKKALKLLKRQSLNLNQIRKGLTSYKAKTAFTKSIKQLALEALDLVTKGENLHNYDYHPFAEDYGDAVSIDNLMIATWSDNDVITEQYLNWIENDANEFGALVPYHNVKLTQNSKHDIEISEWPQKIAAWVHKYNHILSSNI